MPTTMLRIQVVDDNRDGADALGLLAESLGHRVHVSYGGLAALKVAVAFRPDLMLVDLAMPEMDGCSLAERIREQSAFAQTKLVAITGHADLGHRTLAMKAGFDSVFAKPVALSDIRTALASVTPVLALRKQMRNGSAQRAGLAAERLLPIDEARRLRNERKSKALTEAESQAAICACFLQFQAEYLGWRSESIRAHFIQDALVIRVMGGLTIAECQLAKVSSGEDGRDLIKRVRNQLLEVARPFLESIIHEVVGVKSISMHHDISTVTGEEVVLFSLAGAPRFEPG